MKNVIFSFLTNFTGRNGYGSCSGVEVVNSIDREGGQCVLLSPLTSKGRVANCDILVPIESMPEIMDAAIGVTCDFNHDAFYNWSGRIDVRGCKEVDGETQSNVQDPHFWGVYLQEKGSDGFGNEIWMWCVDFPTEKQARSFAELLNFLKTIEIPAK